jgi:hypothetical protein
VATQSYLPDVAGGMVVASAFDDEASAGAALDLLRGSGVRWQDIVVVGRDAALADRIAADRAWTPSRRRNGLLGRLLPSRLPADLRDRYRDALRAGMIVVIVAADGQPPDTIAALFAQANATRTLQWWQPPADLFAPPDLAGPF